MHPLHSLLSPLDGTITQVFELFLRFYIVLTVVNCTHNLPHGRVIFVSTSTHLTASSRPHPWWRRHVTITQPNGLKTLLWRQPFTPLCKGHFQMPTLQWSKSREKDTKFLVYFLKTTPNMILHLFYIYFHKKSFAGGTCKIELEFNSIILCRYIIIV